jgi:hypothetical protein
MRIFVMESRSIEQIIALLVFSDSMKAYLIIIEIVDYLLYRTNTMDRIFGNPCNVDVLYK